MRCISLQKRFCTLSINTFTISECSLVVNRTSDYKAVPIRHLTWYWSKTVNLIHLIKSVTPWNISSVTPPPSQCALYSVSSATSLTSWPWNLYISGGRGGGYFYSLLCLTSCIKAIQLFPHPATIWLGSLSLALMEYRILRKTRLFHI